MRTVVIYKDKGPHDDEVPCLFKKPRTSRQQAPKIPMGYLERHPICLRIFDSPGVKVYHFARVSLFRQPNCLLSQTTSALHFSCCQKRQLKP